MKKVFSVLMVCAFAISATAQWLIYDYKVSIKRIDPQYTKLSYKINEFDAKIPKGAGCPDYWTGYFDSFTTANDTLTGYIVMPACKPCGGMWKEFGSAMFAPAVETKNWVNVTDAASFQANVVPYVWDDSFVVSKYFDNTSTAQVSENSTGIGGTRDLIEETAFAYIQRKGDKLYSNPLKSKFGTKSATISKTLTWKLPVSVEAARFGKGAGARVSALAYGPSSSVFCGIDCSNVVCVCPQWITDAAYAATILQWYGVPTHTKPVKEAWMVLTYDLHVFIGEFVNDKVVVESIDGCSAYSKIYPPVKGLAIDDCCTPAGLAYGLLGYQTKRGSISHAGFGKVTTTGTPGKTDVGFCGAVVVDPTNCTAVNTISGTIAGLFEVQGYCSYAPEWDICYYFRADSWNGTKHSSKDIAPVSGNWTLKLNQSESKKYGGSFTEAEARVMDKLKCYPLSTWKTELRANFIWNSDATISRDNYIY